MSSFLQGSARIVSAAPNALTRRRRGPGDRVSRFDCLIILSESRPSPGTARALHPGRAGPRHGAAGCTLMRDMRDIDRKLILIGALFALFGLTLGLGMVVFDRFQYHPVHAHINLLGWVTLAIYGIVYRIYPPMRDSGLALPQFHCAVFGALFMNLGWWILIEGLPIGSLALKVIFRGGSALAIAGLLLFMINVWRNASAGGGR
jgi:hypothetical protein